MAPANESVAASQIQAHHRGKETRKSIGNQHHAASNIQAHYRGHETRKSFSNLRVKKDPQTGGWMSALIPKDLGPTLTSVSVLDAETTFKMTPHERHRSGVIVANMREAAYTSEQIRAVCRALFLTQSEADLRKAWESLVGDAEVVPKQSFRSLLGLLGTEDVDEAKLHEVFEMVDADASGGVEFGEFCRLIKSMNPKEPPKASNPLAFFFSSAGTPPAPPPVPPHLDHPPTAQETSASTSIQAHYRGHGTRGEMDSRQKAATTIQASLRGHAVRAKYGNMRVKRDKRTGSWMQQVIPKNLGPTITSVSSLDAGTSFQMTPAERVRAGRIVHNMREAQYTAEQIKAVCRALFRKQTDADLKKAWEAIVGEAVSVERGAFFNLLALLGDDELTPAKVEELFSIVDQDKSGSVDFKEFSAMIKAMNPKDGKAPAELLRTFFSELPPKTERALDSPASSHHSTPQRAAESPPMPASPQLGAKPPASDPPVRADDVQLEPAASNGARTPPAGGARADAPAEELAQKKARACCVIS